MISRFRVMMELVKPEKPDPATTFKGFDYIDVPGLSKKEYKLNFYAHREGTFSSKVGRRHFKLKINMQKLAISKRSFSCVF